MPILASSTRSPVRPPVRPPWRRNLFRDQRGGIIAFVTRIVLGFAIVILLGHEVGKIVFAQVRSDEGAHRAATAAAQTYYRTKNANLATLAARDEVNDVDQAMRIISLNIGANAVVTVTTEETAKTIFVYRFSILRKFGIRRSTASETATTSGI